MRRDRAWRALRAALAADNGVRAPPVAGEIVSDAVRIAPENHVIKPLPLPLERHENVHHDGSPAAMTHGSGRKYQYLGASSGAIASGIIGVVNVMKSHRAA